MTNRQFTPEEDQHIRANWEVKTDAEIGDDLGRSHHSVEGRRCRLGLFRTKNRALSIPPEVCDRIRQLWPTTSANGIARQLDLSQTTVIRLSLDLGLPQRSMEQGKRLAFLEDVAPPAKPKGFSADQLKWAIPRRRIDREAEMVVQMASEYAARARGVAYRPRLVLGGYGGSRKRERDVSGALMERVA